MRISKGHGTGQVQPLLNLIQFLQVNTNPFPFTAFQKRAAIQFQTASTQNLFQTVRK